MLGGLKAWRLAAGRSTSCTSCEKLLFWTFRYLGSQLGWSRARDMKVLFHAWPYLTANESGVYPPAPGLPRPAIAGIIVSCVTLLPTEFQCRFRGLPA